MSYKVVEATSIQDAVIKSGFVIGQPVIVQSITVSSAGPGKYTVIPLVIPIEEEKENES